MSIFGLKKELNKLKETLEYERYRFRAIHERNLEKLKGYDELKRKIELFESDPFKEFISKYYTFISREQII